jgi:hypothetical protein
MVRLLWNKVAWVSLEEMDGTPLRTAGMSRIKLGSKLFTEAFTLTSQFRISWIVASETD